MYLNLTSLSHNNTREPFLMIHTASLVEKEKQANIFREERVTLHEEQVLQQTGELVVDRRTRRPAHPLLLQYSLQIRGKQLRRSGRINAWRQETPL